MLSTTRERLTLALLLLLPFHALLVTVGTKLLVGPGNDPHTMLALWKEAFLGVILLISCVEFLKRMKHEKINRLFLVDPIDIFIVVLILLSAFVTLATHRDAGLFALGFKYDFVPLIAFMVLRRTAWSSAFIPRARAALLAVGALIAGYGLLTFVLPTSFFVWLGYSDLHSLYMPEGPLAAYQQLGGMGLRRIQSVMSGPNQLGLWLLIPWSIALLKIRRIVREGEVGSMLLISAILALVGAAMLLTFSRSAWIAAALVAALVIAVDTDRDGKIRSSSRGVVLPFGLFLGLIFGLVVLFAPEIVTRAASTREHWARAKEAVLTMTQSPLGRGLGAAGPASNHVSDPCVFLEAGADYAWAQDRPELCVHVGGKQVQPAADARVCRCPILPENWYLQIGVELGWIGLALYVALTLMMLVALPKNRFVFYVFLGVSTAALFLHAWEGTALAYSTWVCAAAVLPSAFTGASRLIPPPARSRH